MQTLWTGGPVFSSDPDVFPLSTDSILLADFARPGSRDRFLDLGCGSGILPLLLCWDRPGLHGTGLDISENACSLSRRNLSDNALSDRVEILQADLRTLRTLVPSGSYDLTISNPPYFVQGRGYEASGCLGQARSDSACSLLELCEAAAYATRWGGRFCLVFRPERMGELFSALDRTGFSPKRLRPVHHSPHRPANLILLEAARGGGPGLVWETDLYLMDEGGRESKEYQRIYHRGKEQPLCQEP